MMISTATKIRTYSVADNILHFAIPCVIPFNLQKNHMRKVLFINLISVKVQLEDRKPHDNLNEKNLVYSIINYNRDISTKG